MSSKKLTQDEIDALISSLDKQGNSLIGKSGVSEKDVKDFSFGSDDLSLLGDYYALRVINERFARLARSVFQPMLRVQPRISAQLPSVMTFDEYSENAPPLMSLTTSRIDELRGSKMMVIQPEFISALTNAYYGGDLGLKQSPRSEFTSTESRVIEIITDGLNQVLLSAWQDLLSLTFSENTREENLQFASFVDGAETVIVCSFDVQLPKAGKATIDILYPLQTLKPIAAQLRSRMQSEVIDDDLTWRERLERAVLQIAL
ncbi:flagellar motor switch protein FliM, partial [Planktotalea arctica]|uniref:flagellar motor switch protein FliM n=1 Tax=Planktotalea arctica TaxID=1481893 RepID=UPI00321A4A26